METHSNSPAFRYMRSPRGRRDSLVSRLGSLGIDSADADQLRLIQLTLHRWDELQCGTGHGCVEVDDDGRAYWLNSHTMQRAKIPNRGAGAVRRLAKVMARYPWLWVYHQSDCRGCALYVGRLSDIADIGGAAQLDSYYNRGVAVCV